MSFGISGTGKVRRIIIPGVGTVHVRQLLGQHICRAPGLGQRDLEGEEETRMQKDLRYMYMYFKATRIRQLYIRECILNCITLLNRESMK